MKKWFESKMVWFGIFSTLGGVASLVAEFMGNETFASPEGWGLFAFGIINVIVRVWFTDVPIE